MLDKTYDRCCTAFQSKAKAVESVSSVASGKFALKPKKPLS